MPAPALAVEALEKTYQRGLLRKHRVHALRGVSLNVEPGEVFGLLGPNGAGKTTLVKILLSIVYASSGTARLFGVPATDPKARRRVGFLPENHRFPPFLTARQMLRLYGTMTSLDAAALEQRIPVLLDQVRMTDRADDRIGTFSKGMMQRVGLAQALLHRPDLVFLDEPTDGVDPVGRREIRDLLLDLRALGTTVFLNSHLLSEVEQVCTRVAIMHEGELVRTGSIEALTQVQAGYRISCTAAPDNLPGALPSLLEPDHQQADHQQADLQEADPPVATSLFEEPRLHHYRLTGDRTELNQVVDALRSDGFEVERIVPLRQSLEDYFIKVIGDA